MISNCFSKYLKKKKPIVKKLVETLGQDFEYVSCLGTDVKGFSVFSDRAVTEVGASRLTESGFVVKVKGVDVYFEYSVNEINEKNFDSIVETIKKEANLKRGLPTVKTVKIDDEPLVKDFIRKDTGKAYDVNEVVDITSNIVKKNLDDTVFNITVALELNEYSKMFISKNKELTQYYTWTNAMAYALARKGEVVKNAYSGEGYPTFDEGVSNLQSIIDYAKKISVELLDAEPPKPGIYTIITDPTITGLIVHEAFGHGVEMDMFVKDRAKSVEYMNKQVASNLVTMHDGANAALSAASYFFDDDGVLAQDTVIIENGILKRGISDMLSAAELGTKPTGNGRRESYKRKAYTRMTNTFFEGGTTSLEDMIKSVDYGYMIFDTDNGMEDPKNWGIQCAASYGREIKNGKFTGKIIAPVVMSGYVIDLLESIEAIGTNFKVTGSGSCGKGYKEWVRVSDGGASLKAKVKIG